jgi:hypothetical protein
VFLSRPSYPGTREYAAHRQEQGCGHGHAHEQYAVDELNEPCMAKEDASDDAHLPSGWLELGTDDRGSWTGVPAITTADWRNCGL